MRAGPFHRVGHDFGPERSDGGLRVRRRYHRAESGAAAKSGFTRHIRRAALSPRTGDDRRVSVRPFMAVRLPVRQHPPYIVSPYYGCSTTNWNSDVSDINMARHAARGRQDVTKF